MFSTLTIICWILRGLECSYNLTNDWYDKYNSIFQSNNFILSLIINLVQLTLQSDIKRIHILGMACFMANSTL